MHVFDFLVIMLLCFFFLLVIILCLNPTLCKSQNKPKTGLLSPNRNTPYRSPTKLKLPRKRPPRLNSLPSIRASMC